MTKKYNKMRTKSEKIINSINDILIEMDSPAWLDIVNSKLILIQTEHGTNEVIPKHVKEYYDRYRCGMASYRYLGDISGDWRNIDNLAETCLYIFRELGSIKAVNN